LAALKTAHDKLAGDEDGLATTEAKLRADVARLEKTHAEDLVARDAVLKGLQGKLAAFESKNQVSTAPSGDVPASFKKEKLKAPSRTSIEVDAAYYVHHAHIEKSEKPKATKAGAEEPVTASVRPKKRLSQNFLDRAALFDQTFAPLPTSPRDKSSSSDQWRIKWR